MEDRIVEMKIPQIDASTAARQMEVYRKLFVKLGQIDSLWKRAACAERAALGWEADANLYKGERRRIRIGHAEHMRGIADKFMMLACGEPIS